MSAALAEHQHESFDEHRDRDGRDEFGQAAARLGGKTHLAPADDFFLDEVLGDIENRHRDDDIADRFKEAGAGFRPR